MGRKRKSGERLPPYVYRKGNWYVWRPYVDGRMGRPVPLVRVGASMSDIWAALEQVQDTAGPTIRRMLDQYLRENTRLAKRTRSDYQDYARLLCQAPLKGGRLFGDADPDSVTAPAIRQYLDRHADTPTAANRRVQFLKAAYAWAFERGRVRSNPCTGVRLHSTPGRDRYVTDAEYTAVLQIAEEWAAAGKYPYLPDAMELAYLCRARLGEVLALKRSNYANGRLFVHRSKGSRSEYTIMGPRGKAVIERTRRGNVISPYLIHNRGQRVPKNSFQTAFKRLILEAEARGVISERFTVHDLKAKGVSDHTAHHSGHRSERMRHHYNRKPDEVEATR